MTRCACSISIRNRKPTRRWSDAPKCRTPATSCITLAGTRAARRCVPTHRIRISSGATCWCRACDRREFTFSTPSPMRRNPKLVKTIEAEEIASRAGYSRPHTVHCGPDAIYVSALGAPNGRRAGRNFPARSRELRRAGAMGSRSRAAAVRVRFLVASRLGRGGDERMGHAEHDRKRRRARVAARQQVRTRDSYLEPAQPASSEVARPRRRESNGARAAPVARSDQDLRLRRRGDLDQGFVGVYLAVVSRRRRLESAQGDRNSRRARRRKRAAAGAQAVQGGAAADHRHQPESRRQVSVRRVLRHRRPEAIRRERPVQAEADGQRAAGRDRVARRSIRRAGRSTARRR